MSVSATTPFTFHDLEGMPENGRRYEVIDGQILVKATPGLYHQEVVAELWMLLSRACPDGDLAVVGGPFAVRPDLYTEVHPDVLVAQRAELVEKDLTTRPALAVEVLADSGRLIDRVLKRAAYQAMGTQSYWIVDPDVPDLLVLDLDSDGRYVELARASGEEVFQARLPFPVRVVPNELLGSFGAARRRPPGTVSPP